MRDDLMLFDQESLAPKKETRPSLPKGSVVDYEIGFLFNFASPRSTNFDLEPILVYKRSNAVATEYKRISLQADVALAYLQPMDDELYNDFLQFSDGKVLKWMMATGNKYIRNANTGSWTHVSARELKNLRKHYLDLLSKLWPRLTDWPNLFILKTGRFNNTAQQTIKLSKQPPEIRFAAEFENDTIVLKLVLLLDGQPSKLILYRNLLLEKDNVLYLPPDAEALNLFELFANGDLKFPLSMKMDVVKKYILPWITKYKVTIGDKLNI
ncbi:MAG TPA: hypothetical protein VIT44_15740, partial [Cyclobacteriaceae bacterium]